MPEIENDLHSKKCKKCHLTSRKMMIHPWIQLVSRRSYILIMKLPGTFKGPVAINDLISSIYLLCLRIDAEQGLLIMAVPSTCDNIILGWYPPTSTKLVGYSKSFFFMGTHHKLRVSEHVVYPQTSISIWPIIANSILKLPILGQTRAILDTLQKKSLLVNVDIPIPKD